MQRPETRAEALAAIPVPMPGVLAETGPGGLVRISHPAAVRPWLARLLPASLRQPVRTLELDAMGTFVWTHIDGRASVAVLAGLVAQRYSCLPAEAEQAVALFVRQLGQRGIVALRRNPED